MRGKIGDKARLQHILDAIAEIERYTSGVDLDNFISNSMLRFASIKQLEIIGEAANHITQETKDKFSDVEWDKMNSFRNILVHEYFGVDLETVWDIIIKDLPDLQAKVEKVIKDF